MENRLRKLFDYQRFSNNPELGEVIRTVESRYQMDNHGVLLQEEDLKNVAGGRSLPAAMPKQEDHDVTPDLVKEPKPEH